VEAILNYVSQLQTQKYLKGKKLGADEFWIIFGFAVMGYKIGFEASGKWIGRNWEWWMFEQAPTWVAWLSILQGGIWAQMHGH
jgi:hypothetical protein